MSNVTRIKICGITNGEDAQAAIAYGADALGFIFVPDTPRYVGQKTDFLRSLFDLPPFVMRVAVARNFDQLGEAPEGALLAFDAFQIYDGGSRQGGEGLALLRAFPVRDADSLEEVDRQLAEIDPAPHAVLLDTYHKDKLGGSGKTFNWELAGEAKRRFKLPIILAGGLTAENVGEAVRQVRPYAVDVSSGVEAEPGRKDHAKLKAFIRAVQDADRE